MDCKENCLHCDDKCNTKSNTNQHGNCELKDEEIIKALECFKSEDCLGEQCPYYEIVGGCGKKMCSDVYDFVNRQKAEIERLRKETSQTIESIRKLARDTIRDTKSEAIKEFAERLKNLTVSYWLDNINKWHIDNLVKEMESEK